MKNRPPVFHRLLAAGVAFLLTLPSPAWALRQSIEGPAESGLEEAFSGGLEEGGPPTRGRYNPEEVAPRLVKALLQQGRSGKVSLNLNETAGLLNGAPSRQALSLNPRLVAGINQALKDLLQDTPLISVQIEKEEKPEAYNPEEVAPRLVKALLQQNRSGKVTLNLNETAGLLNGAPSRQALSLNPRLVTGINQALVQAVSQTPLTTVRIEKRKRGRPPKPQLTGLEEPRPVEFERALQDHWALAVEP
jgi:hypothetical protein